MPTPTSIQKPHRLQRGQTIGLIAPSGAPNEAERVRYAADIVRSFGFKVKTGQHIYQRNGYLAGDDAARAADLNAMFAADDVDAVFCLRGGYGASRLLPLLDYANISAHPKVFLGYSDITALHMAIHTRSGLVTFHGPIAAQSFSDYTVRELKRVLFDGAAPTQLAAPPAFAPREGQVEKQNRLTPLVAGKAQGRLLGGNLSLLAHLCGTPYVPSFHNAILFVEDVGEGHYNIDRYLTQLWLAGVLQQASGIVFGKFTEIKPASGLQDRPLEDVLTERPRALGIPAIAGLMIGHIDDQATIPVGCMAELDVDAGTLTLLEAAVV
jgi:muramoyltetrapeptide carboxypeptidase